METSKILKSDYLDILFEGRNKSYGGYELRKKYPQRVRNAMFIIAGVFAILMGYSVLASMKPKEKKKPVVSMKTVTLAPPPPVDPKRPPPPPPPPAPPPPAKPTVKFTPPVIKKDEEVKEIIKPVEIKKGEQAGPVNAAGDPKSDALTPPPPGPTGNGPPVEQPKTDQIFKYVEQQPQFHGNLQSWLQDHLQYPESARENNVTGKSYIQFVVSEDGSISDATVLRSSGSTALDQEALRVVKQMPKWTPGKNNGQAVKCYFSIPIVFELGE